MLELLLLDAAFCHMLSIFLATHSALSSTEMENRVKVRREARLYVVDGRGSLCTSETVKWN